jgi:hypothetical protein
MTCDVIWPLLYKEAPESQLLSAAQCQLPKDHDGPHRCEYDGEVHVKDRMNWEKA